MCAEGFLVSVLILDSLNTLWHFPISDSDPGTLKGKEERDGAMRKYSWAASTLE